MKILITGGTGFIGSALTRNFIDQGASITLLSREPEKAIRRFGNITAIKDLNDLDSNASFQVIINLAGAPILDARWTEARKKLIGNSRIQLTEQLVSAISRMKVKPELLISGSAIGYYGDHGDDVITELTLPLPDFSQQLCADWEAAATVAEQFDVRVCIIRTGLVLANDGGLLQRMLLPFKSGLGGRLGNGEQWMSWIHRQDWLNIVQAMIHNPDMRGVYNATAPLPVSNNEFSQTLAHYLKRPALLPVPAWLLKLALGEMSSLILSSQRVIPENLLKLGFTFQYPDLSSALNQILTQKSPNSTSNA